MKNKRTYEQYTTILNALKKAYASIAQTEDLQKELKIPSDVTNKLDFLKRTMIGTYEDLLKLQETEKFLWEDSLSQLSIVVVE